MGRELKRVSLDFDWPINEKWEGYINPHRGDECPSCDAGYNKATQKLHDEWYGYNACEWAQNPYRKSGRYNKKAWNNNLTQDDVDALIKEDRLWDLTRVPINDEQREVVRKKIEDGGNSWLPYSNGHHPTAEEVNDWNLKGFGHDSLNCYICIKARAIREGIYGLCERCDGELVVYRDEEHERLYDEWEPTDPPKGPGYQMWENTSEGSPQTPVFETLKELCVWCEEEGASVFGKNTATKEEWFRMLSDDNVHYKDDDLGAIFV